VKAGISSSSYNKLKTDSCFGRNDKKKEWT